MVRRRDTIRIMSLVVRQDFSVPIPEDMAQEIGLHRGSAVRWERAADGGLTLRATSSRKEAALKLRGMLKDYLKPGDSAVADLIREREEAAILEEQV